MPSYEYLLCKSCCGDKKLYAVGYDCDVAGTICGECNGKGYTRQVMVSSQSEALSSRHSVNEEKRFLVVVRDGPLLQFLCGLLLMLIQTVLWWLLF